jgi:hypothetical protein
MHRRNGWILGNASAILTVFREWALRSVAVESGYFEGMPNQAASKRKQKFGLQKLLIGYRLYCNEWNNYMIHDSYKMF